MTKSAKKAKSSDTAATKTTLQFSLDPAEYAATVKRQKRWLNETADKILHGAELSEIERNIAAAALRNAAEGILEMPPRKAGQAPKFCHASEAMSYVAQRSFGKNHGQAIAEIADRLSAKGSEISEQAVAKSIKKYIGGACAVLLIDETTWSSIKVVRPKEHPNNLKK